MSRSDLALFIVDFANEFDLIGLVRTATESVVRTMLVVEVQGSSANGEGQPNDVGGDDSLPTKRRLKKLFCLADFDKIIA